MTTDIPTPLALAATDRLRHAELNDLVALLKAQADVRYDVVVNAAAISYDQGCLAIQGGALRLDEDGVSEATAYLRPTEGSERQVADRLGIPARYMAAMRDDAIEAYRRARAAYIPGLGGDRMRAMDEAAHLLDHNVNHWLEREPSRRFLVRAFRSDDPDEIGVARAFLSDRFGMIDHLDVLMAALDGVRQSGVEVEIDGCDLSERRMSVRVSAPAVRALAPTLLGGYRSPFGEGGLRRARGGIVDAPDVDPVVFAGFAIQNSETGGGAFSIVPRLTVLICRNGMTMNVDALREIHLGGKLDEGIVRWSADTTRKAVELITAKAKDAVGTFLDREYVERTVAALEEKAGAPVADPMKVVERVGKAFSFSQGEQDTILAAFIAGGQANAGGVLHAVTAAAQCVDDPDRAAELEAAAVDVLDYVAR